MRTRIRKSRFLLFPLFLFIFSSSIAQFVVEGRKNTSPWGVLEDQVLCADDQLTIRIDLGMEPKLWLDAMDINSGSEPAPGARIDKWQDKSGNNYTIVAPTLDLQPSYDPAGFNGLPAVMFGMDNLTDGLELFDTSEDDFFEDDWSIAILGEGKDRTVGTADLIGNTTAEANGWSFGFNNEGTSRTSMGNNLQQSALIRSRAISFITVVVKEGNQFKTYVDGSIRHEITIPNGVMVTLNKAIYLGQADGGTTSSNNFHKGAIAEVLIFDRSINESDRIQLEGYLANKWMSNQNLSITHPYKTFSPLTSL